MKKTILLLICFITLSCAYGQKVVLKKEKILVDKEPKFEFLKTKKGKLLKGILPNFVLKEIDGKELLVFTDTILSYAQLPHEKRTRNAFITFVCTNAQDQESTIIGKAKSLKVRKYYIRELKQLGFFKTGELTSQLYQSFIETQDLETVKDWKIHIDSTNTNRLKNYELTKKQFGEFIERKPGQVTVKNGSILDGLVEVGKFKIRKRGSYAHSYEVINKEGYTIATSALILPENRGNIKPLVDNKLKRFVYKRDEYGKNLSSDEKLREMAEYLILQGYL